MGRISKSEERKLIPQLLALIASGVSDEEAQGELGLSPGQYIQLRNTVLEKEATRVRNMPTEHVYVEYCLNQMACIKDLTELYDQAKLQKNGNAGVGAVRARSDIFDKLIKRGQEFGVLEKRPEEKRIVAGVLVGQLTNDQLRAAITNELSDLNQLVDTYGEKNILDVDPGQIYFPEPPDESKVQSKTNRSKVNKVHGGRRVVKTKLV